MASHSPRAVAANSPAEQHRSQRQDRRNRLDEQDSRADGLGAIHTGDDHTDQEEDLGLEADRVGRDQAPDQPDRNPL